jgi:hypothetical protein
MKSFGPWEEVGRGLVEHEAERTHVDTVAGSLACIEELYVAVLEEPELESLSRIVHLCCDHRIGQLDFIGEGMVDIEERDSLRETLGDVDVLATDLKHGSLEVIVSGDIDYKNVEG